MEIKVMDKATAKAIGQALAEKAQEVAKQFGLVAVNGGGKYGDTNFTAKVVFSIPVSKLEPKTVDEQTLQYGLAKSGTQALFGFKREKVVISGARRTKYVFSFLEGDKVGKEYIAPFHQFHNSANKVVA